MIENRTRKAVHFRPSPPPSPKAGSSAPSAYSTVWGRNGYAAGNNTKDAVSSSSYANYSNNSNSNTAGDNPLPNSTPNSRVRLLLTLFAIVVLSYVTIVNMFHRSLVTNVNDKTISTATTTSLRGQPVTTLPLPDVATAAATASVPVTLAVRPAPLPLSSSQIGAGLSAGNTKGIKSYKKLELLSKSRPVTADVHGNLGAPSVVTNESIGNWLTDRWQAALNMKGEAIPGEHWIEIDLQRPCRVEKVIIDWEDAYSTFWTLQGRSSEAYSSTGNVVLGMGGESKQIRHMKHHVVYELHTPFSREKNRIKDQTLQEHKEHNTGKGEMVRYVRLMIHQPSMHWGSSIWRLQLWGTEAETANPSLVAAG